MPCLRSAVGFVLLSLLAGCGTEPAGADDGDVAILDVWVHAGRQSERETISRQVDRFNEMESEIRVELTFIPEGAYNAQVQAAALAGDLPDVLEFDGPFVYNYVWQGKLFPLEDYISLETFENLIPSIVEQGTYNNRFWTAGMYDSGLALYASREKLESVGARIPEIPSEAWTVETFDSILSKLAAKDEDGRVLDLKLNYRGEWFTYAFYPALASAGGGLIRRPEYDTAQGVLDGEASIEAMSWFQRWTDEKEWVDANVDDNAFVSGRVALSWVGHWEYERYSETYGNDLVLLPLPDFGQGSHTAQGSWSWGITRKCQNPEAAGEFIEFLLQDRQVLEMAEANGAVPGTRSAIEKSVAYGPAGERRLFVTQLTEGFARPRPRTPGYPVITSIFQNTFKDITNGADVGRALRRAAEEITRDIRDNKGYPNVSNGKGEDRG